MTAITFLSRCQFFNITLMLMIAFLARTMYRSLVRQTINLYPYSIEQAFNFASGQATIIRCLLTSILMIMVSRNPRPCKRTILSKSWVSNGIHILTRFNLRFRCRTVFLRQNAPFYLQSLAYLIHSGG